MTLLAPRRRFTEAEYLNFENAAISKSEYDRGYITAMAGASPFHNFVKDNLIIEIGTRLRGSGCRTVSSDQRVRAPERQSYFYPDVMIQCGKGEYDADDPMSLLNPTVIIEVLSESTAHEDRIEKLRIDQSIRTVREIALVSQVEPVITVYSRTPEGFWAVKHFETLSGMFPLDSVGVTIPLADVYRDVEFQTFPPKTDA